MNQGKRGGLFAGRPAMRGVLRSVHGEQNQLEAAAAERPVEGVRTGDDEPAKPAERQRVANAGIDRLDDLRDERVDVRWRIRPGYAGEGPADGLSLDGGFDAPPAVAEVCTAPGGVKVLNPAFDVTPAALITAIVTEKGIIRAPYGEGLKALFA